MRFYEREGLLTSERTAVEQCRYHADVLCRVAMIQACRRAGPPLAEIRVAVTGLPEGHVPHRAGWDRLAAHIRTSLRDPIDELTRVLDELAPDRDVSGRRR